MLTSTLINVIDKPKYASMEYLFDKKYSHLPALLDAANIDIHPQAKDYSVSIYDIKRQTDMPHFFALTHCAVV